MLTFTYRDPLFQVEHHIEMSEETFRKLCRITGKRFGRGKSLDRHKSRVVSELIKNAHKAECGRRK